MWRFSAGHAFRPLEAKMNENNVLIVGAGPAGLTLANDLKRRRIAVMVVDKAAGPATTSRALGLHARGREILACLGALGDLPDRAVHAAATNIRVRGRLLTRFVVRTTHGQDALGPLLISQAEIEARLRRRLVELGGEVRWGHEVVRAVQHSNGVEVRLRTANGEHTLQADWVVGCDGAHSAVRDLMHVDFEGRPFPEMLVLADVALTDRDGNADEGTIWLHPDGMIGIVPLPRRVWRVFAELAADDPMAKTGHVAATALRGDLPVSDTVLDRVRSLLRERVGDSAPRIVFSSWTSVFRFHRRIASAYRRQRMFVAGDAAHIHSALGGQGMNTGIGDAFNLGWKLACVIHGGASEQLLDTYEAERRPVAADVVRQTSRAWNILLGRTVLSRLFRDHVLLPLLRSPAMQRRWVESGSQLRVNYRGGPLAPTTMVDWMSALVHRMPLPGDRGPNVGCRRVPSGEATTLGKLIAGRWALLLFGGSAKDRCACIAAARRRLDELQVVRVLTTARDGTPDDPFGPETFVQDDDGGMVSAYRPGRRAAILLRPDGHIAWRSSQLAPEGLLTWLHRALDARHP
jgi:4,5-epoxidase